MKILENFEYLKMFWKNYIDFIENFNKFEENMTNENLWIIGRKHKNLLEIFKKNFKLRKILNLDKIVIILRELMETNKITVVYFKKTFTL